MITLAIDSASKSAGAALLRDGEVLLEIGWNLGRHHGETLLPVIDDLYRIAGRKPAETNLIALTTGPGSFTGLRIGASVAKGLAFTWGIPVAGVSTLAALALNGGPGERPVCPMLDARKEEVYTPSKRFSGSWKGRSFSSATAPCATNRRSVPFSVGPPCSPRPRNTRSGLHRWAFSD
jgi:tRNA threonylcarbamoyladenosine biosynthesis protein TsaB